MIISGIKTLNKNLVNYILDAEYQVASNGIYFTLGRIFEFGSAGEIDFDCKFEKVGELNEIYFEKDFSISLKQGSYYVQFNEQPVLPSNILAVMFTRAHLVKTGLMIDGPIIDNKSKDIVGAILTVVNPHGVRLTKHARLCKCMFIQTDDSYGPPNE